MTKMRHFQDFSFVVVLLMFLWMRLTSAYSRMFTMTEYCGDLIDMERRHLSTVRVKLTELPVYRPHLSCSLAVRAAPQQRLLMVVRWIDVAEGRYDGCSDYLSVWEGDLGNKTGYVEGLNPRVCGKTPPRAVTSQGRSMLLHFDSNTNEDGAGFLIIITAFHEGTCFKEEFRCDNGRCIDTRLKCDEYDNCGDDSDDCVLSAGDVVIAVIVTTIVFFLIVGGAVLYCHRDKINLRKKCPIITANPDGVYQPTTEPAAEPALATKEPEAEATTAV